MSVRIPDAGFLERRCPGRPGVNRHTGVPFREVGGSARICGCLWVKAVPPSGWLGTDLGISFHHLWKSQVVTMIAGESVMARFSTPQPNKARSLCSFCATIQLAAISAAASDGSSRPHRDLPAWPSQPPIGQLGCRAGVSVGPSTRSRMILASVCSLPVLEPSLTADIHR